MNDLSGYSKEDLETEIERRKRPVPNAKHDDDVSLTELRSLVVSHVSGIVKNGVEGCDDEHYIYVAVMEMFYGKKIWKILQ